MRPVLAALLLAALATAGPVIGQEARSLTVTGTGEVEVVPDLAVVSVGVEAEAPEAMTALSASAASMQAVFDALDTLGIATEDIQTSEFSLNPVWTDGRGGGDAPPEITGYRASNLVTVRLRDIASTGPVIDALAGAGANRFNGVSFSVADPDPLRDEALRRAIADAQAKADLLAESAGISLGPVTTIREAGGPGGPIPLRAQSDMAMASPIAEGSLVISASVEVVYALE